MRSALSALSLCGAPFLGALFLGALLPVPCAAQRLSVEAARARIEHISNLRGHESAEEALTHARRAVRRAQQLLIAGDDASAARALQIADAALVLADRLAAASRARQALADVQEQKRLAHVRTRAAREALERAIRQRDEGRAASGSGG